MRSHATICIATGTRADWGLLSPIATALRSDERLVVQILATNMHTLARFGNTSEEIRADGFAIDALVPVPDGDDSEQSRAEAMAACLGGTAEAFGRLKPDAVVALGDRFEMLAVASAAAVMRIPIVHIAGGEITEGAVDDCLRHAITKLASLHLTATEAYRRRVISMGEDPAKVITIGAPGVWNAFNQPLPTDAEVLQSLGIAGSPDIALVTFHPATLDPADPTERFEAVVEALNRFKDLHIIITYPNNDARSQGIISRIESWSDAEPKRVTAVKSLGMKRYLAASRMARVVVGNSSSGIVEVPSAGTPTVDIGIRQRGRVAGASVIHCGDSADEIAQAISHALSFEMQALAARRENPYAQPDTIGVAARAITDFVLNYDGTPKKFYQPC